jgi:hypothetical protein
MIGPSQQRLRPTAAKSEIKLTNVARASLSDELLRDYESVLRQNGIGARAVHLQGRGTVAGYRPNR